MTLGSGGILAEALLTEAMPLGVMPPVRPRVMALVLVFDPLGARACLPDLTLREFSAGGLPSATRGAGG